MKLIRDYKKGHGLNVKARNRDFLHTQFSGGESITY